MGYISLYFRFYNRLSKPSLVPRFALPRLSETPLAECNSVWHSESSSNSNPKSGVEEIAAEGLQDEFIISPALQLPESFGSAYVGETFSCTLCVNNELSSNDNGQYEGGGNKSVTGVKLVADMQTPSRPEGVALNLSSPNNNESEKDISSPPGGSAVPASASASAPSLGINESMQKILQFELKEEGTHVLVVTLTYTETKLDTNNNSNNSSGVAGGGGGGGGRLGGSSGHARGLSMGSAMNVGGGRVRTFRKLYQFAAQQILSVRTKAAGLPNDDKEASKNNKYVLEAQLENLSEYPVSIEAVDMNSKPSFKTNSLNWVCSPPNADPQHAPILKPRDNLQVAFLLEDQHLLQQDDVDGDKSDAAAEKKLAVSADGKTTLGQLAIQWRTAMGDRGSLSTGWLTCRRQ